MELVHVIVVIIIINLLFRKRWYPDNVPLQFMASQEVPENKRRNSLVKGIVIARRNAGLNTTIRLRRMVAGVGVESLLPL